MFKQAARLPDDPGVRVSRDDDGKLWISTDDDCGAVHLSEYNAARVFGMLALFLEIPLPKHIGKAIKLGDDVKGTIG